MRHLVIVLPLFLAALWTGALAQPSFLDEETEGLLVQAVEAAAELDLFYARCRADASYRRTENLNKLLAGKFRMTVIGVQDDLFPEGSYRSARERLQRDFAAKLREAGGCRDAREGVLADALRDRYDTLLAEIERLP